MKAGSLCTGIGGLDLAVEAFFGCGLAWFAEWEDAPALVIDREWPGVPNLRDLTAVDWADVEPIDVLTAGYPCQPFSHAGKRKGSEDERHLWPHIAEAVRVLRPRWVVLENVAGHLSLGFGDVLRDLAEAGFAAEWCVLRASDVGAPHQRARLFIVAADTDRGGRGQSGIAGVGRPVEGRGDDPDLGAEASHAGADLAAGARSGRRGRWALSHEPSVGWQHGVHAERGEGAGPAPDPHGDGFEGRSGLDGEPPAGWLPEGVAGDATDRLGVAQVAWGKYEAAIRLWEHVLGRAAPAPTDTSGRLAPPFVEWMMGYPTGWVADLSRTQALKALGNAVVPQQGLAALCELVPAHLAERAA